MNQSANTPRSPSTALILVATVAVIALVGVGVLAGVLIGQSGGSKTSSAASAPQAPGATSAKTTTIVEKAPPPRKSTTTVTVPTPSGAPATVQANSTWPGSTSAWTVVLASVSTRAEAEAQAARADRVGLSETGVLLSTEHSSLRAGYWVAYSGVLSHDAAVARQQQARNASFADAYARYVSAG